MALGWCLETWIWGGFPPFPNEVWLSCTNTGPKVFVQTRYFPSGNLECWYVLWGGCLCGWRAIKALGTESKETLVLLDSISRVVPDFDTGGISTSWSLHKEMTLGSSLLVPSSFCPTYVFSLLILL